MSVPNTDRFFFIRHALRAGFTIQETTDDPQKRYLVLLGEGIGRWKEVPL